MYLAWHEEETCLECSVTRVAVRIRDSTSGEWSDPAYVASLDLAWDPEEDVEENPTDSRSVVVAARGRALHVVWIQGESPNRKVMHRYFQPPGENPLLAVLDPSNWSAREVVNETSGSDGALPKIYVDDAGRIYAMWKEHSYTSASPGSRNTELHLRYVDAIGTGVELESHDFSATGVSIGRVRPNPFQGTAETTLVIPMTAGAAGLAVEARVYDVRGVRVRTVIDGMLPPGSYRVAWEGNNDRGGAVSSGVYFMRIVVAKVRPSIQRLVLLR
jgi:hypothetical protein